MASFSEFMQTYENHYHMKFPQSNHQNTDPIPVLAIVEKLVSIIRCYNSSKITSLVDILAENKRMFLFQHQYIRIYIYENIISLGEFREPLRLYFLEFIDTHKSPAFQNLHIQIDSICFVYQNKVNLPNYIHALFKNATPYLICKKCVLKNPSDSSICNICLR